MTLLTINSILLLFFLGLVAIIIGRLLYLSVLIGWQQANRLEAAFGRDVKSAFKYQFFGAAPATEPEMAGEDVGPNE